MKQLFLLTLTLLTNSLCAMQPAPAPAGTTPMQVEGPQQPAPNSFVFYYSVPYLTQSALAKVTPEQIIAEDAALLAQKEKLESNPQLKQQYEELQQKITDKKREIDSIQKQIRDKNSEIDSIQKQIEKIKNNEEKLEQKVVLQKILEQEVALQKVLAQKAILVEKEKKPMNELSELIEQENKIQARKPASEPWMTDLSNFWQINTRFGEENQVLFNALNKKNLELFKQAVAHKKIDLALFIRLLNKAVETDLSITEFLVTHAENIPQEIFKSAFDSSHYTVVPFLLDKAFTQEELEQSSLHVAILKNNLERIRTLIKKGEDVNKKISFGTKKYFQEISPLHLASIYSLVTIAELLIENGANINAQDKEGNTPLHYAISEGKNEIDKLLIENGADVNAQNISKLTPLHFAVKKNYHEKALLLINKGASLFARTIRGYNPFDLAESESTKNLLQEANVNTHDQDGRTPLHYASQKGLSDAAKNLIDRGAAINAQDNYGRTPLHYASFYGREDMVNILLAAGADRDLQDTMGKTAFDTARSQKNEKIEFILKEAKQKQRKKRTEIPVDNQATPQPGPAPHEEDLETNTSEKSRIKQNRTNT